MKATLLALLTLGSLAMANQQPQAVTVAVDYSNITENKTGDGNSDGVVLTLSNDATRYVNLSDKTLASTVTLTSIEIADGYGSMTDSNKLSNKDAIITDSTGLVLGWSQTHTTKNTNHVADWGTPQYSRNFTTFSNFMAADGVSEAITLNAGDSYYIYFGTTEQVYALFEATFPEQWGDPFKPVTITSEYYTKIRFTSAGTYDAATAAQFGFINGAGKGVTQNMAAYAPMMAVTVENINVPEPATGALSLLALAGLCIRRRK